MAVGVAAEVVDDDVRAAGGEQFGVGAADAASRAGHDDDAVGEVEQGGLLTETGCGKWGTTGAWRGAVPGDVSCQGRAPPPGTSTRAVQMDPCPSCRDFSKSKTSTPQAR
ncbi:hypothetical protein GCM10010466_42060 [Planomonospora alba]|uniref:Uncharacterized protein n=1 Tax=Planomonospora alba TaxID=161354 RepID=A0ABP6NFV7_9ACTN